ncbi:MAG: nucleotidyltransferase domain-containing protein [Verrucomicrobiota bacterium]|nr:nucleotidyltransferase domain-containing protein [Verrucomicrobiota bacterium]
MTSIVEQDILREITERIVREVAPAKIILFGSRARGDSKEDSDFDLLVVQDEPFPSQKVRLEKTAQIYERLADLGVGKDILFCPRAYIERWRDSLNHVVGRAFREGRLLYERN